MGSEKRYYNNDPGGPALSLFYSLIALLVAAGIIGFVAGGSEPEQTHTSASEWSGPQETRHPRRTEPDVLPSDGDFYVDKHRWITVQNVGGVANGNGVHAYGTTCSINETGALKVLGTAEDDPGSVLLEYIAPEVVYGALCPTGTLFRLPRDEVDTIRNTSR